MEDITSMRVAELGDWINDHNGNVPKRSSSDPVEKRLGAFLANLRTSKKNAEAGTNRKPLFWCDTYITILESKSIDSSILDGSTLYVKNYIAKLKEVFADISENGERPNSLLTSLRVAKANGKPKWNPIYQQTLEEYNETAEVPVRNDLFLKSYQEHRTIEILKGILERMKERQAIHQGHNPNVGISRQYDYAPRNHALRYAIKTGQVLSLEERMVLKQEQEDASFINNLRQVRKNDNRKFLPIFDTMCVAYEFPELLHSVDNKKSS